MKNIVLCGSMKLKNEILELKKELEDNGYNVLIPDECLKDISKEEASRRHFDKIIDKDNNIVLIVNATKNGIFNYIGPNTFAEIAFAFYFNKDIYLLNDIYDIYKDELEGWNVKTLKGDLSKLYEDI